MGWFTKVVRYSALVFGVAYGWYHRRTLQSVHEKHKIEHAIHNRERLVREAKEAFRRKKEGSKNTSCMDLSLPASTYVY